MMLVAITGASGGGKSTLLETLGALGYVTEPEVGRGIVAEQLATGGDVLPWIDPTAFRDLLFQRSLDVFDVHAQRPSGVVFFDRTFLEALAFSRIIGAPIPEEMARDARNRRFARQVFVCPPWREIFVACPALTALCGAAAARPNILHRQAGVCSRHALKGGGARMARTLSRNDARRFYDKFGAKQDRQGFYEDGALDLLIELGNFSDAERVFELGCGTGRLAERLLCGPLRPPARYVGVDLSSTMVRLASTRLSRFADRCEVHETDGGFDFLRFGASFDRIVTTYVLDLLSPPDIQTCLASAHAALAEGGLFCHVGLTGGIGPVSKAASALWASVHRLSPRLVGGCRPLQLTSLVSSDQWQIVHRQVVVNAAIPSEVVILQKPAHRDG